eukprot:gb/GECG01007219.1/.p1 GENE.gb/GECG01007219.1/~~gb/GECG01007219.1/.p1  ORF type:complete len:105 (+),score=6.40 gb/GECG01007219.1/:1-315(+)
MGDCVSLELQQEFCSLIRRILLFRAPSLSFLASISLQPPFPPSRAVFFSFGISRYHVRGNLFKANRAPVAQELHSQEAFALWDTMRDPYAGGSHRYLGPGVLIY